MFLILDKNISLKMYRQVKAWNDALFKRINVIYFH